MHKKAETQDFDIPKDDIDCWDRYPKHRWVYELSRLLDSQNIKWSPFAVDGLPDKELNIDMYTTRAIVRQPGYIYTKKPEGPHLLTEVYVTKGEIKLMRHIDPETREELSTLNGEVELRLSAFITLYFQKFTGVMGVTTFSNEIFHIQLRPHLDIMSESNQEVVKIAKRISKKIDITIHGLTDRTLHESLAS